MTENEALEILKISPQMKRQIPNLAEVYEVAVKALEEIQQYRAIGTVARFEQLSKQFAPHCTDGTSCQERRCNKCDMYRKENEQYRAVGTVEECRIAVERMKPKIHWLSWQNGKEWGTIECPMLGESVMTYYKEGEACYYSYTAPFVEDGEVCYYRYDHDEGCWDEDTMFCLGEYEEGMVYKLG